MHIKLRDTPLTIIRFPYLYFASKEDLTDQQYSIIEGNDITTGTVSVKAGQEARVFVNYTASSKDVTVTWDNTNIEAASGNVASGNNYGGCTTCSSHGNGHGSYLLTIRGWNGTQDTSELYGVRAEVTVGCEVERAMCLVSSKLRYPILYKAGTLILREWLASTRLNFLAIHSKEWAKEKIMEWEEVDYKTKFELVAPGLANFLKQVDPKCINCGGLTYGSVHP